MPTHLPRIGAWLLCLLTGCTRNDAVGRAHPTHSQRMNLQLELPLEGELPALNGATAWLNSQPLTPASVRGKVVLVQFWTYSCINWRRTLPMVRAWSEKYADAGLVVVGVHTPEFDFEKDLGNVRQAVRELDIHFPVAVDSERAIWSAFGNEYWPGLYFVDARGRVRHHQFGEGEEERSETIIQQMLADAGAVGVAGPLASVAGRGAELAADWTDLRSPETYLSQVDSAQPSAAFDAINQWALIGDWSIRRQSVLLERAGGKIAYRFHARDLHLVMGPARPGAPVRFRVHIDGRAPAEAHGVDIDSQGNGAVREPRMYQLIRQNLPIVDRDFQIEFLDAPAEAFSITFG